MKLRDIINTVGSRLDWIRFNWDWVITGNGAVLPDLRTNLNTNSDVTVVYQWYHHMNPDIDMNEISNVIETHDYDTFYKWYKKFETDHWTYFPSEASIFVEDEYVGDICIAYDPNVFALITCQDHECG